MSGDRLSVSLEMDRALHRVQCLDCDVLDAARSMLAAADRLDGFAQRFHVTTTDLDVIHGYLGALVPGGYYHQAETRLAEALGLEFFEGAWTTDDYRVLCTHLLREGD